MAELKTQKTNASVNEFLNAISDERKREDSFKIMQLMKEITGEEPSMWGPSIVGFGSYHYRYASGRENDWFLTGFSPRKQNLTIYFMSDFTKKTELLLKLGKFKTGKSCLYINRLEDIKMNILRQLIKESVENIESK